MVRISSSIRVSSEASSNLSLLSPFIFEFLQLVWITNIELF